MGFQIDLSTLDKRQLRTLEDLSDENRAHWSPFDEGALETLMIGRVPIGLEPVVNPDVLDVLACNRQPTQHPVPDYIELAEPNSNYGPWDPRRAGIHTHEWEYDPKHPIDFDFSVKSWGEKIAVIPRELWEFFGPQIEQMFRLERGINPHYEDARIELTVDQRELKEGDIHRKNKRNGSLLDSWHLDNSGCKYGSHTFVVSNLVGTEYAVRLLSELEEQGSHDGYYWHKVGSDRGCTSTYTVCLMSDFQLHRSTTCAINGVRTFIRLGVTYY